MGFGSVTGKMSSGNATSVHNVLICNMSAGAAIPVGQYNMTGQTLGTIKYNPSNGTYNMGVSQSGNTTRMWWTRNANNGNVNDSQIVLSPAGSRTVVLWATGFSNTYAAVPQPNMSWVYLDFTVLPSVSPSVSPSPSASPSPSPSVSSSASPSASPAASVVLTPGLVLSWWGPEVGGTFTLQAVLSGTAW